MQKLAEICIQRPVFAAMLILFLVVVGVVGFEHLPVDRYPAVELPRVMIRTEMPGAAPEEIEVSVSYPIEEAVNTVEGVTELRSVSSPGVSMVIATFDLGHDIDIGAQDIRDRVAQVARRLPREVDPPVVNKFDSDSSPVLTIALSGARSLRELTELADKRLKRQLERAIGVGEVRVVGGLGRTVNIWLDAARLAAYDLPVTKIRDAIARQNSDIPGGNVTTERSEKTLRTLGRIVLPASFMDLVVETRDGVPLRISDLGVAEDGTEEPRSTARLDGIPTVVLEIRRQSGSNTIAVINAVKSLLPKIQAELPADLRFEVIRDQSRYIEAALHEIEVHLIVGSVLASLVVLLFLRSWRSTLVAAIAIPTSVITTFALMWVFGFTLNSVTMLALVLMVGVVIDDAIVVLENIHRFASENGVDSFTAAREATREIGLAVMATTMSLVVIFVPVSFMSSISGRFLYQFGITAASAILVSLLVSFTLTPMMSARLLRNEKQRNKLGGANSAQWWERGYLAVLRYCLRFPLLTMLFSLVVMASAVPLYNCVRQDYIPSDVDEGEFDININGPDGLGMQAMDGVIRAIELDLKKLPEVRTVLATTGGQMMGGVSSGGIYVKIAPHSERRFSLDRLLTASLQGDPMAAFRGNYSQREVMARIRNSLKKYVDLRCSLRNQGGFNLGGGNFEIDFALRGPDLNHLVNYGQQLKQAAIDAGGMVDLDTTLRLSRPELQVEIDRQRAADLGVDTQDIAFALRLLVGGEMETSRFRDTALDEEYDVRMRLRAEDRTDVNTFGGLLVPRGGARPVRLDNLVQIREGKSASRIDRVDRQRQNSLRGGVASGEALSDCTQKLRDAVQKLDMPPQFSYAVYGKARELERTFDEFVVAFLLSLAFMYMILAALYESLWQPALILLSLPCAAPFALVSLLAANESLNLYSALGMLVLFGMVKKNSILQVDHQNQLLAAGMPHEQAVLVGSRDRLRPILMTTLAFVAGMLPLALGSGPGAEERRAISVVVIGGQILSLLLSLVLTPVAYSFIQRRLFGYR